MVELSFEVLLLLLAILGLFVKHYLLKQFLRVRLQRSGQDFFQRPMAVAIYCLTHGLVTTIIVFAFWGWYSAIIGVVDALMHLTVKYWYYRTDDKDRQSWLMRQMDSGLEALIYELFYVSMAFLALTTHIRFGS